MTDSFARKSLPFLWVVAILGLALATVAVVTRPGHRLSPYGAKQFDHFSIVNTTADAVQNVQIEMTDQDGHPWEGKPDGYQYTEVAGGDDRTEELNLEPPGSYLQEVKCTLTYMQGTLTKTISATLLAPTFDSIRTFTFSVEPDPDKPGENLVRGWGTTGYGLTLPL